MRLAVSSSEPDRTARALDIGSIQIAGKTGTAEVGAHNEFMNSWAIGFWPYENPRYAFILLMDKAPRSNALGATRIMGGVFDWMKDNRPQYLGIETSTSTSAQQVE